MCAADCPGTRFRQSPVFHFPLLDQRLHGFRHILDRHIRVGAMLIKKIEAELMLPILFISWRLHVIAASAVRQLN